MKSVLITGATGFVGRALTAELLKQDYEVHIIVRPASDLGKLDNLPRHPIVHVYDGTTSGMLRIVSTAAPRTVFHLAALSLPEHDVADIERLIQSNILFGTQLLEAAARNGVHSFINTGTFWQHYDQEAYNPVCLYAATKQAFEDILRFYREARPLRSMTLTLFDTYGHRDNRKKIMYHLMHAHSHNEVLKISPGEQLLNLTHIDDVVSAYVRAEQLLEESESWSGKNFTVRPEHPVSLRQLVSLLEKTTGSSLPVVWGGRPYRDREVMVPWVGEILPGWRSRISLEQGIRLLLEEQKI